MVDPLKPSTALLAALGSTLVHFAEFHGQEGSPVDLEEAKQRLLSADVQAWLVGMRKLALLPLPRGPQTLLPPEVCR